MLKETAGPTSTVNHPLLGRTCNKAASTEMLKGLSRPVLILSHDTQSVAGSKREPSGVKQGCVLVPLPGHQLLHCKGVQQHCLGKSIQAEALLIASFLLWRSCRTT